VKPAPFEYHRPESLAAALDVLSSRDDAKPLAGGQSLIPAMNFRLATPAALVDLNGLSELSYIREEPGRLRIGAMTRQRAVERSDAVKRRAPLLAEALAFVAHPAIRTRGTIGGSLAHADPAAELPAIMLALGATLRITDATGTRDVAAANFFTGLFSTAIQAGGLLTEIVIPDHATGGARSGWSFQEFSRRHGDYALAGVAAAVTTDGQGRCTDARIALLSVGDRPLLAERAAGMLTGQSPTADVIRAAAALAASEEIDPTTDIHASSRYRRHLADVLTRRALSAAFERAQS